MTPVTWNTTETATKCQYKARKTTRQSPERTKPILKFEDTCTNTYFWRKITQNFFKWKITSPKTYKFKWNSRDKNKEVQMHLHWIIKELVCLLSTVIFPKKTFTRDKYLILLKSNSPCVKLFCKTNNSVEQAVFITKTCFLYQTVCANSATFPAQYTLYRRGLPETRLSTSIFLFVNYFFQKKGTNHSVSKSSSQPFNKEFICLTNTQGNTNVNRIIAK